MVLSATFLVMFAVGAVYLYFFEMMLSGSVSFSFLFAALYPVIGGIIAVLLYRLVANMAVTIVFLPKMMVWRTKDGRLLRAKYTEIREVDTSRWKGDWPGGICNRYVISLGRSRFSLRGIWLTADNKARLDRAAHRDGTSSFPPFDATVSAPRP